MAVTDSRAETIRIVDIATRKPVQDVWVVTKWEGDFPGLVQSESECLGTWLNRTDGNGEVDLRKWSFKPSSFLAWNVRRIVTIYKHGYIAARAANEMLKPIPPVLEIERSPESAKAYLTSMNAAMSSTDCEESLEAAIVALPLFRDIVERLDTVRPTTIQEAESMLYVRNRLDRLELGQKAADRRLEEELAKLRRWR